ncbi:hypothetical protein Bbelb_053860 [Branchiostoma belcheri]|nr:hypothetical protein Bbelb_053860 [Branchiostoma belcheri]
MSEQQKEPDCNPVPSPEPVARKGWHLLRSPRTGGYLRRLVPLLPADTACLPRRPRFLFDSPRSLLLEASSERSGLSKASSDGCRNHRKTVSSECRRHRTLASLTVYHCGPTPEHKSTTSQAWPNFPSTLEECTNIPKHSAGVVEKIADLDRNTNQTAPDLSPDLHVLHGWEKVGSVSEAIFCYVTGACTGVLNDIFCYVTGACTGVLNDIFCYVAGSCTGIQNDISVM